MGSLHALLGAVHGDRVRLRSPAVMRARVMAMHAAVPVRMQARGMLLLSQMAIAGTGWLKLWLRHQEAGLDSLATRWLRLC